MKLSPEMLLEAYQLGFFPMGESRDSDELMWVKPKLRGVFPLDRFHMSRSLRKIVRQDRFDVRIDTAFTDVMQLCASEKAGRDETWINDEILEAYAGLHAIGHAHSLECWRENQLVGGLYGVSIAGAFFGESMFSLETDASKVALCHLVGRMKSGGYRLLDSQFLTPHLETLGAIEVPAEDYEDWLDKALGVQGDFNALPAQISGSSIVQLITQTS
ncbi:MAG: leucyl/phenylalanyl-tRNA--protein transferase [Parvularculaceae bacterium]|nr:leucyl/phenylalanyl-tRNA--protein transferase [Parvularculaceae bacterium]